MEWCPYCMAHRIGTKAETGSGQKDNCYSLTSRYVHSASCQFCSIGIIYIAMLPVLIASFTVFLLTPE